jgi:hypothetical protein
LKRRLKNISSTTTGPKGRPQTYSDDVILAEQDISMVKLKQKISVGFRTNTGADNFCIVRGFISTARKQQKNILQTIYTIP